MTHELKCWPPYYQAILDGEKKYELRKDDRDYIAGRDDLLLREWNPETKQFTGRAQYRLITHILRNAEHFGLKSGFCIISIT